MHSELLQNVDKGGGIERETSFRMRWLSSLLCALSLQEMCEWREEAVSDSLISSCSLAFSNPLEVTVTEEKVVDWRDEWGINEMEDWGRVQFDEDTYSIDNCSCGCGLVNELYSLIFDLCELFRSFSAHYYEPHHDDHYDGKCFEIKFVLDNDLIWDDHHSPHHHHDDHYDHHPHYGRGYRDSSSIGNVHRAPSPQPPSSPSRAPSLPSWGARRWVRGVPVSAFSYRCMRVHCRHDGHDDGHHAVYGEHGKHGQHHGCDIWCLLGAACVSVTVAAFRWSGDDFIQIIAFQRPRGWIPQEGLLRGWSSRVSLAVFCGVSENRSVEFQRRNNWVKVSHPQWMRVEAHTQKKKI